MTPTDQTAPIPDQAAPPAGDADKPAGDAAPALVEVVPGLLVKFTRTSQLQGDQTVVGIVIAVEGDRSMVAELPVVLDVPSNALRSVSG